LDEAYAIQEQLVVECGWPAVGWKIGVTDTDAQRRSGLTEPVSGRVFRIFLSPAEVPISQFPGRGLVEAEIALQVGTTLSPRPEPYDLTEVGGAVVAAAPAFELGASRIADLRETGYLSLVADNSGGWAMVVGSPVPMAGPLLPMGIEVSLAANGDVVAAGSASTRPDPFQMLAWLVNHLSGRGLAVQAGTWVCTGAQTPARAVTGVERLRADFGPLGTIDLALHDG
jgi:2-keto-4-pentenoate hydratase